MFRRIRSVALLCSAAVGLSGCVGMVPSAPGFGGYGGHPGGGYGPTYSSQRAYDLYLPNNRYGYGYGSSVSPYNRAYRGGY